MTGFITWLIVSTLILTITVWVHKHTYGTVYYHGEYIANLADRVPFPMWLLILFIIISFTPMANVIAFCIGVVAYLMNYVSNDIALGNLPKWAKSITEFFTMEI